MKNIRRIAAGIIALAAITSAPLVPFAAPAYADTGVAKPVADAPSHMNIPPSGFNGSAHERAGTSANVHGQSDTAHANRQAGAPAPIGTPASLTAVAANLRLLPTILENVDRHR